MDKTKLIELSRIANNLRISIIESVYNAGCGHPGGSLSIADILTYLYFEEMNIDPSDPKKVDRDRFVLSKGHTAPALYAALAERGFFPKEDLKTLRKTASYLQGHPDMKGVPGVDMSTGSLGQGISTACGMALSAKVSGDSYRVYTILGDGESQEGQVWEAAMFASHYKLDNLIVFVDANRLQIDGNVCDVMTVEPIDRRFEAFGWYAQRIDGHDFEAISNAVENAKKVEGKPCVIVCDTVKGKGVSFMENKAGWHGVAPKKDEYEAAIKELSENNV
jgi:transketolase